MGMLELAAPVSTGGRELAFLIVRILRRLAVAAAAAAEVADDDGELSNDVGGRSVVVADVEKSASLGILK